MRVVLLLLSAVVWFGGVRAGAREGRHGNALLAEGNAESAEVVFLQGTATPDVHPSFLARLQHNLGLARARQENAPMADSAFVAALRLADRPSDRARYAFNAGTAALIGGEPARAVEHLRRALVLQPDLAAARRNLEIALRSIEENKDPEKPEPSDFAKKLKEQADALVAQNEYLSAQDLMNEGLTRDSTVAAYADFMNRLNGVASIEQQLPGAPAADSTEQSP